MPVRNFRYLGDAKVSSFTDASGVGELYDVYDAKARGQGYPATLGVTSSLDTDSDFHGGSTKVITFNLTNYFVQEVFTLSIVFNGTATSGDFFDSTGTTFNTTPNTNTGLETLSAGVFEAYAGAGITNDGETFTIRLEGSINGIVYEKLCTIRRATFTITPQTTSFDEGDQMKWTVDYTNWQSSNQETLYWACTPDSNAPSGGSITSADLTTFSDSGNITIPASTTPSSGSLTINGPTLTNDLVTDGSKLVYIGVAFNAFTEIQNRYIARVITNVNDTSLSPTATVAPSTTSLNEGSTVTFTITTTNFTSGTLPWEVVLGTNTEDTDVNVNSGNVTISSSSGTVQITATSDGYTESGQGEGFRLRVNHPNTGAQIGLSPFVFINDTSTGTPEPAQNVYTIFRENRFGSNIGTITHYAVDTSGNILHTFGSTSGNNGNATWLLVNYSTNQYTATGQFRFAWRHLNGSSFRGDYAIDNVQYYLGNTLQTTYGFESGTITGWLRTNGTNTTSSVTALANASQITISTNTGVGIWNVDSGGTPSNGTGPNAAYSGAYFAYTETSSNFNGNHWLFSPVITP